MSGAHTIDWQLRAFDGLSRGELYALLQLRSEVFVVEQNCTFQDLDGADAQALHLLGCDLGAEKALLAYARCFPAGVKFAEASIGRVVTRRSARGGGLGHALIAAAVAAVCQQWGPQPIRIGAQARLNSFYCRHGFVDVGRPYLEDGIEHLEMLWQPQPPGDLL